MSIAGLEQGILACEQEGVRLHRRLARQNRAWALGLLQVAGGIELDGVLGKHRLQLRDAHAG